ncbi:MAG: aspartate aminotransferase family protein [Candidatus Binatia bacterium]
MRKRYGELTGRSAELYARAVESLPGGNTRTTIYHQPHPIYVERGEGCLIYDVDGVARVDFINNYTSLILGHCHPRVVAAVRDMAGCMMSAAAPSELEIEVAGRLKTRLPSIDLIRFTNSGTEATMMAIRAARAFTGRAKIAKFDGGYHGTHDYAAVGVATAGATGAGSQSGTGGLPAAVADTVVIAPYNDRARTEAMLAPHRGELAAVIVEPIMGAAGVIPADPEFLVFLRDLTHEWGSVLIFDEVISFRTGYHGAQGRYGVIPDLTALGKIIGGGLPAGAFGGREEIMSLFDPRRPGYLGHGGTFNANPLTMAAGLATLDEMTPERYAHLERLGSELRDKLAALFASIGLAAQVNQVASLFNVHLTDQPVTSYAAASAGDRTLLNELYVAMLNHGVAFTGRGMGCLSTPMGSGELDAFVDAARRALRDLELG